MTIEHPSFTDYFPEGYYKRFLDDNSIGDTPAARAFFSCVCLLGGYHGEESVEYLGNLLAQWELKSEYSRLHRRVK
jgi:hypothetical protein